MNRRGSDGKRMVAERPAPPPGPTYEASAPRGSTNSGLMERDHSGAPPETAIEGLIVCAVAVVDIATTRQSAGTRSRAMETAFFANTNSSPPIAPSDRIRKEYISIMLYSISSIYYTLLYMH
jgi:hypothetical protein